MLMAMLIVVDGGLLLLIKWIVLFYLKWEDVWNVETVGMVKLELDIFVTELNLDWRFVDVSDLNLNMLEFRSFDKTAKELSQFSITWTWDRRKCNEKSECSHIDHKDLGQPIPVDMGKRKSKNRIKENILFIWPDNSYLIYRYLNGSHHIMCNIWYLN